MHDVIFQVAKYVDDVRDRQTDRHVNRQRETE